MANISSYSSTSWKNGDIITSEKLNNLENGIASAENGVKFTVTVLNGEPNVELVTAIQHELEQKHIPVIAAEIPFSEGKTITFMLTFSGYILQQTEENDVISGYCFNCPYGFAEARQVNILLDGTATFIDVNGNEV